MPRAAPIAKLEGLNVGLGRVRTVKERRQRPGLLRRMHISRGPSRTTPREYNKRTAEQTRCLEHSPTPTAAERMLALRRRIAEKAEAERTGNIRHVHSAEPETGDPRLARQDQKTNEVSNMHQDGLHREGAHLDTAVAEDLDAVRAEGRRDTDRGDGGGATEGPLAPGEAAPRGPGVTPAATAAAASSHAWHSNGCYRAA